MPIRHNLPLRMVSSAKHRRRLADLGPDTGCQQMPPYFRAATLYRHTGKLQVAREHLTMAVTMYREMGMHFYLEQGEAESK
jgi:hypothetical protein